jgi:type II secretory pathway component GspD/PulD (secretin)
MRLARLSIAILLTLASTRATAQQQSDTSRKAGSAVRQGDFIVKTITLHHLASATAVKLLAPYSATPGGGVFEVPNVMAVTIREVPRIYNEMLGVLEKYDRDPATVVLNFQLVSAEQTNSRDPAVAGIDSLLRGVLKFSGYRLLGTAMATTGEAHMVTQTIAADNETLSLTVEVRDVRVEGNDASVNLYVSLERPAIPAQSTGTASVAGRAAVRLLSTGVTVPMGQTVLLGTSASDNGQRALILTVRPQLAKR